MGRYRFSDRTGAYGYKIHERRRELVGLVAQAGGVSLRQWALDLGCGVATIFEDLSWLEDAGYVHRTTCSECGALKWAVVSDPADTVEAGRSRGVQP